MAHDDGEAAATGGEDRLSALPDELIIKILLRLATDTAARTSVLSRRWRLLWCLLPELHFVLRAANAYSIRTALGAHDAPSLRQLLVLSTDGTPESMPEWLPVAARRLSGELIYIVQNKDDKEDEAEEGGAFLELPCFGRATNLSLVLGFNTLAVPPSGVFARLTELFLETIRFHGPCELGDAVSSARSPSLKELTILDSRGLSNFTIHSDSLVKMVLNSLKGLQQLNVVAPALQVLHVQFCFAHNPAGAQPVADISAPQLEILQWNDAFDSSSVQFSKMANLEWLGTYFFHVYGHGLENSRHNHNCLRLLQRFQFDAIPTLSLSLSYFPDINDYEYLMEDMTVLPDILFLNLTVLGNRHAIGPSLFHILRMCTGLRRLKIVLIVSKKPQRVMRPQHFHFERVRHQVGLDSGRWTQHFSRLADLVVERPRRALAVERPRRALAVERPSPSPWSALATPHPRRAALLPSSRPDTSGGGCVKQRRKARRGLESAWLGF
ncbi:hypothetical protein GUJ93_ZPchr0007g5578 [Zizania palustris]|uniref:F-box domain-containing protein n=1 Tax=Zizania palustris TaxID=103762 RepID=A0A8J5SVE5_ZIZPA|nr:hypothetical protein GUJ93_ZPchr0007g5578 [Zizania palustris]